jgi:hypothetical protein
MLLQEGPDVLPVPGTVIRTQRHIKICSIRTKKMNRFPQRRAILAVRIIKQGIQPVVVPNGAAIGKKLYGLVRKYAELPQI